MHERANVLQWAIEQLDKQQPRDERDQVERNYLHELEQMRNGFEQHETKRANRAPSN